jgi:hypothetical protein
MEKIRRKNKIAKYSKLGYNCAKFEYVVCRDVFQGWKKFGGQRPIFLYSVAVSKDLAHDNIVSLS